MGAALVCKRYKKVAFAHTGPKEAIFTRLRCKQWACPSCAQKNASIWRAFLKERLPDVSQTWWLLTLTAHPNTTDAQSSLSNLRKNIERILKRAKRVFDRISYVRVFERHPTSQRIHAHFIISGLLPFVTRGRSKRGIEAFRGISVREGHKGTWSVKTWFKKTSHSCDIGHICDVRPLVGDIVQAVLYVCKYLTCAQQELNCKGLRHVQTSRDIGSPKTGEENTWNTAAYIIPKMFNPNTKITDLNTGFVIDNNHWEKHSFYPHED